PSSGRAWRCRNGGLWPAARPWTLTPELVAPSSRSRKTLPGAAPSRACHASSGPSSREEYALMHPGYAWWGARPSGAEECGRHDRDAVPATVRIAASGDDDSVQHPVSRVFSEPVQVTDIPIVGGLGELDLERDESAIWAGHDEIDLVVAVASAQVSDVCFGCLRVDTYAQRHERLEEMPEHRALLRTHGCPFAVEQRLFGESEEPDCKSWVCEVVLR